ncbi:nuclear transport factor 2 family protein [Chitinimonas sp. BJB300]|uniref:nuclear transport factor 2 family protein n=1 Tax=Chitinimonas sp. BJB300 TaxID=1559339 RepID=UPI000C0F5D67|nr:nuclear transport factor 2 family protein [Chitinimonas sp. BJB300]PHV12246.1 ketosteroid isomerase [Chitinimonas sp. BJB300]TSJ84758.1 nuclear transport factor 2 family protein [Chitinimonas sp. BJB300]
MSTMSIAKQLVALCKERKTDEALDTLYAADALSVEALEMPNGQKEVKGHTAIKGKGKWWIENHEVHSANITGPWPHGDRFAIRFQYDVTNKPSGKRMQLDEIGLYTVKNGKIVREEFFYDSDM